ncbi:PIG-L deacetylase family protein [Ensifer sp. YR511]|uniref:PIG-L deacetylase family protein n=1 Tax=Ensifer sp. YR511 TaxID=1855294 RepID=UPI0008849E34|nr:PIG-L deacetylase family protein [Ensifer sp. YR511]SDN42515.1 4-oxalomesaconate hydratase [Ensifer sp. YR511]
MPKLMLVIAHPGDFVWRAAGTIAKHVKQGMGVDILSITTGARGESPKLWTSADVTLDQVVEKRRSEAEAAADILGANLKILGLEDFPLVASEALYGEIAEEMRASQPDVIITHTSKDPSNIDHVVAYEAAVRARMMVTSPGRGLKTIKSPKMVCFEPHFPEQSGFLPNLLIDISDVWDLKRQVIEATPSQSNLWDYYLRLAEQRGSHAGVKYAEAFQRLDSDVRHSFF